ncbi:MAG: hypothetical protein IIW01_00775, partial [Thermoguttaceae bacterium]|nr:hypothetical protein [Thermoguttaceae bacterium]
MKPNDKFNAIFRRTASLATAALATVALGGLGEANGATLNASPPAPIYVANNVGSEPLGVPIGDAAPAVAPETPVVVSSVRYPVARREVSWRDARGTQISALVFYPAAPPVAGSKFSVVVYSHGLGGSAERFAYLGEAWAARGVATLCLRHPESDETVWRGKLRPMG